MEKLPQSKTIKKDKKPKPSQKYTKFLFENVLFVVGDYLILRETNKTTAIA